MGKRQKLMRSWNLEALWDDGYGTRSVQDYLDISREMVKKTDGGPPRWFCPAECGNPIKDSPVLLFSCLGLEDIIPKETLLWKLKLLKSAADLANSRLHDIKAKVLVLASGKDNLLPSGDEARRLWVSLENCKVRYFKDNGHALLLESILNLIKLLSALLKEDGLNMLSIIKATRMYHRFKTHDYVSDFIPVSKSEVKDAYLQGALTTATSPVMLSTMEDGKIVRGLDGIPSKGPVLLVGYHTLMGLELTHFLGEFWREKQTPFRSLAHPEAFFPKTETSLKEFSMDDFFIICGGVPVSPSNLYRLLSNNSFILRFPGGAREALHRKGEEYKCFWPDQPEFVRMAAKFGATIVPFGVVGEDDITQISISFYVLDYDDQMKIPFLRDFINESNRDIKNIRCSTKNTRTVLLPIWKTIETKGMEEEMKDKDNANAMYLKIKSEVENLLSYLLKKREEDPYRGIIQRSIYKAMKPPTNQVPTFEF
ncbi:hypothetical protein MKX01_019676 [Papaver californicum]|nr:hypothetical protein MKX01_019676 [Papaver californicum]